MGGGAESEQFVDRVYCPIKPKAGSSWIQDPYGSSNLLRASSWTVISLEPTPSGVSSLSGCDSWSNWKFPETWVAGFYVTNLKTGGGGEMLHLHCEPHGWQTLQPERVTEDRDGGCVEGGHQCSFYNRCLLFKIRTAVL